MEICGEHGDDIAYSKQRYATCPACDQLEQIETEYIDQRNALEEEHKEELHDLNEEIERQDSIINELSE